jgi:hypothetical protein
MITSLRQRHRRMFALIGVLLPLAFVAGIVARRTVPATSMLPPELSNTPAQTFTATGYEREDAFENAPVTIRLWRDLSTGQAAVGFSAPKDFVKPDLIAYWITRQPTNRTELPADVVLLGSFVATALPLPAEAATAEGSLILFSLADQEIVDISKPLRFGQSER